MKTLPVLLLLASVLVTTASARAACDSTYMPLKQGATRHYTSSNGYDSTSKVTKIDGNKVTLEMEWIPEKGKTAKKKRRSGTRL